MGALLAITASLVPVAAQQLVSPPARSAPESEAVSAGGAVPPGFVIGADDILSIVYWREAELSADVVVRPDGNISLPLLNDVPAAGLTPETLRLRLTELARKFVADPSVSVVVKTINSRKIFITGNIQRPGAYMLTGSMTVLQLIAMAGGVLEYADTKNITIMRTETSGSRAFPFNFKDVSRGKKLEQNIELRPGDTVIVP
jgi:polysaccharide export outer membrane protein